MQMTGQERIPAPRRRVWDALYDPDILRQCIPGCQSLAKESAERMRATADIKMGPIGARFNGMLTLSDVDPPNGYTLTIEAQGGTVGLIRSGAKVRLADDGAGGTILSYEIDAQVSGRLAQLGGPLIDATARQLAGRFFRQFATIVTRPTTTPEAAASNAAAVPSAALAGPGLGVSRREPRAHGLPSRGSPVAWMLGLVVAALVGYLVGHAQRGGGSDWMGLAVGLLLLIVAATAFELGRRAATPVVTLDASLLARLIQEAKDVER
jgi:uncharacterized protein